MYPDSGHKQAHAKSIHIERGLGMRLHTNAHTHMPILHFKRVLIIS